MGYVNCGAFIGGRRAPSKKALKEAVRDCPERVTFDSTAFMGPRAGDTITCDAGDIGGNTLSVCGPDPYTRRVFYANVAVRNGKIIVT